MATKKSVAPTNELAAAAQPTPAGKLKTDMASKLARHDRPAHQF